MYYHALKLSRLAMLTLAGVAVSASAIAADSAPTSQIGPTAEAYIVSHPDKVGEVVATYLAEHPEFLVAASETLHQRQRLRNNRRMFNWHYSIVLSCSVAAVLPLGPTRQKRRW